MGLRMLRWLLLMMGLATQPAIAGPDTAQIEAFFKVVQTGTAAEMQAMINATPALATATDQYGFQAIHVLDYIEFAEKLALLQSAGADINARNDEGMTLLHFIIEPAFVPLAVQAGADANARDLSGRVPLMVHLLNPDATDMVLALLDAGADPAARDSEGMTVQDYARNHMPELLTIVADALQ